MKQSKIHLEPQEGSVQGFRTAVSLHSHTLHSKETLAFIGGIAEKSKLCRTVLDRGKERYRRFHGTELNLHRGWWTPPLTPSHACALERQQIEGKLGLRSMVSLTDHDNIEAALSLHAVSRPDDHPVSVEWTVPYGPTFFHLGVHNLPPEQARRVMHQLSAFTASQRTVDLEGLLRDLTAMRETLIVFNHPCWDEQVIGADAHKHWLCQFLRTFSSYVHAFELNGLRPWHENRSVIQLAHDFDKPVISGGDRHALEPNTTLDLTDAGTFAEYVEQVRSGYTDVFITRQYLEPFTLRVLESLGEVLSDQPEHGRGWKLWSDRVFFQCEDGVVRSLSTLFAGKVPPAIRVFVAAVHFSRHPSLRQTFRLAFPRRQEFAL